MAKLNFIESQHPRMLSYVECRSDPVFYLVEEESEPALGRVLDELGRMGNGYACSAVHMHRIRGTGIGSTGSLGRR